MGVPLIERISWTCISWRASHRRVCYGRLISIVAITGVVIERVKRTCEIRWLVMVDHYYLRSPFLIFKVWDVALFEIYPTVV